MELKRTFENGRMNSDVDPILLPKGDHISSENIDFFSRVAVPMKDAISRTDNGYINAVTRGVFPIPADNKIYHFYTADNFEGLDEFDTLTYNVTHLLQSSTGALGLTSKITGINKIGDFVFWVDKVNPPRRVDTTITYALDGFTEKDISVMKPAPRYSPTLSNFTSSSEENNIEEKFLSFAYRYKYITGEFSAYSPFSRIAFIPEAFDFDFATNVNNGMVNQFNEVNITYNVGDELVKEVQLVFRESGSNSVKLIDTFNKEELGYSDNSDQTYKFTNNKEHRILPTDQLSRLFDNVPLNAEAQEVIGNLILYGNYLEGRDIVDENGDKINIDHTIGYTAAATPTTAVPQESCKSNRDLEFSLSYLDDEGRMTTPLVSKDNTVFIKTEDSVNKNTIQVTIPHKAPAFASSYRFLVKQNKLDYETIIPSIFYEDGVYRWVKFQEADKDKINVGEYLVVKRDTAELLDTDVEVKILESGYKERNFLRPELDTDSGADNTELRKIQQLAGYYFKIKPLKFNMDIGDLEQLEDSVYHNTRNKYDDYFQQEKLSIGAPALYGDDYMQDYGIKSQGTYSPPPSSDFTSYDKKGNQKDIRFKLTFDSASVFSVTTNISGEYTGTPISAGPYNVTIAEDIHTLGFGVQVNFPATTDSPSFNIGDSLVISAKQVFSDAQSHDRAVACLEGFSTPYGLNEEVEGGAQVNIYVKEYGGEAETTVLESTTAFQSSTRYDNLEEWWHEDSNVITGISSEYIIFRRGYKIPQGGSYKFYEDNSYIDDGVQLSGYNYPMHMFIRGQVIGKKTSDKKRGKIRAEIKIVQSSEGEFALFETRPIEAPDTNIYYEIGDTYDIDANGNHLGTINGAAQSPINTSQVWNATPTSSVDAVINLKFFNCYSFGNGVESYKIKDAFNAPFMRLDARGMSAIDDYKSIRNDSDLTHSGAYSKSTNVNKLNEFNLSTLNFKELSTKQEGPIRLLATRKGDVVVFQDQMVSKVLFGRTILSNVDGTQNVVSTNEILGAQDFYSKKFGIGDYAESYAEFGNNFYFADPHNGTFVRGGFSGLDEIVIGRKIFFKDEFLALTGEIPATYDLYKDAYIASMNSKINYYKESASGWTTVVDRSVDRMTSINNRTFGFVDGDIIEFYEGNDMAASIKTSVNEFPHEVKVFESVKLESAKPLTVSVDANHGSATVYNFDKREDFYFGDLPKSESGASNNKYGIGEVTLVDGLNITIGVDINPNLMIGDELLTVNGKIGTILSTSGKTITVDANDVGAVIGDFLICKKNGLISGDSVRGVSAVVDINFDSTGGHKLTAVNLNVNKSFQ